MLRKIISVILAAVMLCGMTGCAKSDTLPDSYDSHTEDNAESGLSKFDLDEAVKDISLFGNKFSLPCTIANFGKDFSLNDRVTPIPESNDGVCQLLYKGKIVGGVTLADWNDGENQNEKPITGFRIGFGSKISFNDENMRKQYLDSMNRYSGELEMNVAGITYTSSSADIIAVLGEPTEAETKDDGTEELFYQYPNEKSYIRVVFCNSNMIDFYLNI